jgi:hypothetical protein
MALSVGSGSSSWSTHAAWMELRVRKQQLQADRTAGADQRVLESDEAALRQSAEQVTKLRPGHRLDVTA